ncbi:MAG: hypothetical protein M0T84_05230 [Betaproteobacteria bacterium]|nr:hypothetical protein [Betaproteobacteria bacterium]
MVRNVMYGTSKRDTKSDTAVYEIYWGMSGALFAGVICSLFSCIFGSTSPMVDHNRRAETMTGMLIALLLWQTFGRMIVSAWLTRKRKKMAGAYDQSRWRFLTSMHPLRYAFLWTIAIALLGSGLASAHPVRMLASGYAAGLLLMLWLIDVKRHEK